MSDTPSPTVPNHHHDHPGFSGVSGTLMALAFSVGRSSDARLATRLVDLQAGDVLVDVGCGSGAAARHAAGVGAAVIGVDPAPVMIRTGRLLTWTRRVDYRQGTAEDLPVDDGTATVLWGLATVHHWADLDAALAEARRVLRPGGRFLAIERRSPPGATGLASHGWTDEQAEDFARLCRDAGFTDAEVDHHTTKRGQVTSVRTGRP